MRFLGKYLSPFKWKMTLGLSIKVFGTVIELFLPLILTHILENVIGEMNITKVILYGALMIFCALTACVCNIIANRMAYEVFGDEKYKEQYESMLEYAFSHFADKEYGEWYGYLHYDSTPSTTLKGNIFKGPFHLPRMLMVLTYLEGGSFTNFFK